MLLIIDPDWELCDRVVTYYRKYTPTSVARTGEEALQRYMPRLNALIIGSRLSDDDGFTVARTLRGRIPGLPTLVVLAEGELQRVNVAYTAGLDVVTRPIETDTLRTFRRRALLESYKTREGIHTDAVGDITRRWCLTIRQGEIVDLLVSGVRPTHAPSTLGISHNTFRSHARQILQKSGMQTLAEVTRHVLLHAQTLHPRIQLSSSRASTAALNQPRFASESMPRIPRQPSST